jgi:hypothetical protein
MSAADCRHARLHIGAAPHELPPGIAQHLAGCAECSRFRDETLALDARLRSALEVPLPRFRERAPRTTAGWRLPLRWRWRCCWPAARGS